MESKLKIDAMNATGEASGNLLLSEMGYPHHIDFIKQHEHDQETMQILQDQLTIEKQQVFTLGQVIEGLRNEIAELKCQNQK